MQNAAIAATTLDGVDPRRQQLAYLLRERRLDSHRRALPNLPTWGYFNFGTQGLMPQVALDAINEAWSQLRENAPFSTESGYLLQRQVQEAREAVAEAVGAAAETVSLVENTTSGCNVALWGIAWQQGDHLLVTDHEYPGVLAAIRQLAERFKLDVGTWSLVGSDGEILDRLSGLIRPETRLLVASHVTWDTGRLLPLSAIAETCHRSPAADVLLLADGAQAAGVLPLDLATTGADFYTFPAHKWWCGPEGLGALYTAPRSCHRLSPTFIGVRSLAAPTAPALSELHADGRRFETSTLAAPLLAGWRAAIRYHDSWGDAEARYQRLLATGRYFWQALGELADRHPAFARLGSEPPAAGLSRFRLADRSDRLARALESQRLLVRTVPGGAVRASVHYLTDRRECERLLEALDHFAARL